MARLFDDGSTQYLIRNTAIVTAYPFTMACWANTNDDTLGNQGLMSIADKDAADQIWELRFTKTGAPIRPVRFRTVNGGSAENCDTSTEWTGSAWHHACAVGTSSTSRTVYLNGAGAVTVTTDITPANLDRNAIGNTANSALSIPMSGAIAEAAIWSIALAAAEVAQLAQGFSPLLVRPESLVAYWPLVNDSDIDWIGALDMTPTNTPTTTDHPIKTFYPSYILTQE